MGGNSHKNQGSRIRSKGGRAEILVWSERTDERLGRNLGTSPRAFDHEDLGMSGKIFCGFGSEIIRLLCMARKSNINRK